MKRLINTTPAVEKLYYNADEKAFMRQNPNAGTLQEPGTYLLTFGETPMYTAIIVVKEGITETISTPIPDYEGDSGKCFYLLEDHSNVLAVFPSEEIPFSDGLELTITRLF